MLPGSGGNGGGGGGVYNAGAFDLNSCTITKNTNGYGIPTLVPLPSGRTITAGGMNGSGGGVFNAADGQRATLRNSLVALNSAGTNLATILPGGREVSTPPLGRDVRGDFSSRGHNLIGYVDGAITTLQPDGSIGYTSPVTGFTNGVNGDIVGTFDSPIDPLLGPLQDNGGPTFTHALLPGSPAIDAGKSFGVIADQRGFARTFDFADVPNAPGSDATDIGAFELSPP